MSSTRTSEPYFFKILVIGDGNVGKTSLLNTYVNHIFLNGPKQTIGVDIVTKEVVVNNTITTLQIWDTAGQERFNAVSASYYRGADCVVLVYDVTYRDSFTNLDYWRNKFFDEANADPTNFPLVLIGNKVDLPDRQVKYEEADEWCNSNNQCPYYESSAKDGINVEFVFQRIAETTMSQKIEIWDTANQERFDSVCESYYRGADCVVLVYDVTDENSFKSLDHWKQKFLEYINHNDPSNFPFCLIANKVDLPDHQVTAEEAEEWCNSNNQCPYYEASAKDGINVDCAFHKIAEVAVALNSEPSFLGETFKAHSKSSDRKPCKIC